MAKIPSLVKIGAFRFDVRENVAAIDAASTKEGKSLTGYVDREKQIILLRPGVHADTRAETLLHEVLHGITGITGIEDDVGEDEEEKLVTRLACSLLGVLRDNPELVDFLREET